MLACPGNQAAVSTLGHVANRSKAVRFRPSKCFPVCASKQTRVAYEYTPRVLWTLGVIPFVLTDLVRLVILIALPLLALWLPTRMGYSAYAALPQPQRDKIDTFLAIPRSCFFRNCSCAVRNCISASTFLVRTG